MSTNISGMTENECRDSVRGAYLTFVRDDGQTLYVVSEWKIVRFYKVPGTSDLMDLWDRPYVWDFGAPILNPDAFYAFLGDIVGKKISEKKLAFEECVHPEESQVGYGNYHLRCSLCDAIGDRYGDELHFKPPIF
jgi:hypothetical protein